MEVLTCLAACCTIVGFVLDLVKTCRRTKGGFKEDDVQEKK